MGIPSMFMFKKNYIVKIAILLKTIYIFCAPPIIIPMIFFMELDTNNPRIYISPNDQQMTKVILSRKGNGVRIMTSEP